MTVKINWEKFLKNLFQLAENLDGQLARMGEDLKEVISHLNTSTKSHDSKDPVYQIGKVLGNLSN